ncbi:MAG: SIS domain-containing protein [Trueperaceae bacterium]|nr:SIS domain-containing protein [Trueperaceae bacterium]
MSAPATHLEREIFEQPDVLRRVLADDAVLRVGREIAHVDPHTVLTLARGSSDNAVTFFAGVAGTVLGVPVASIPPSLPTLAGARLRAEGGLGIGVSQSGESRDVVAALRALEAGGIPTLAVANPETSALARGARWSLSLHAGEERSVAASKTFTSQMMVLARVVAAWADDAALHAALAAVPDAIEALLRDTRAIDQAAVRWTHGDRLVVLGRGPSFGPAAEVALKTKETAYLHAHAYSSAEFQHGPIASLGPGDPVWMLAPCDATLPAQREAADRLVDASADLTVVSADPDLLAKATTPIPLPEGRDPITDAFLGVVVGQWLALRSSLERGLDPDAPRHLRKVTQTR